MKNDVPSYSRRQLLAWNLASAIGSVAAVFSILALLNPRSVSHQELSKYVGRDSLSLRRLQYQPDTGVLVCNAASSLTLGWNPELTEEECHYVAGLTGLRHLMIAQSGISPACLDKVLVRHRIQTVLLGDQVRDEHCFSRANSNSIQYISIDGGRVTYAGLLALGRISSLTKIEISSTELTLDEALMFKKRFPSVEFRLFETPPKDVGIRPPSQHAM